MDRDLSPEREVHEKQREAETGDEEKASVLSVFGCLNLPGTGVPRMVLPFPIWVCEL